MKNLKLIYASAVAAIISIAYVTAITIGAELSAPFKSFLKSLTGHHWTTKSVSALILYFLVLALVFAFSKTINAPRVDRTVRWLVAVSVFATAAIFLFFVWHFFFA